MTFTKLSFGALTVAFTLAVPAIAVAVSPFVDVIPGKFYETPVNWAFNNGITTGKDATHFDPEGAVTRGESVTFLKRYDDNIVQPAITGLGQTVGGLNCTNGQVAKFDGTNWVCGTDTDTTIAKTDGLASLGCRAGQVAHWDGSSWRCGTVSLATRVGIGTSATLNATGFVGFDTSVAIGADDLPVISYRDVLPVTGYYHITNKDLKVFHCADIGCTSGNSTALDSAGQVGQYTAIAMGTDGRAVVSYHDTTNSKLKVARATVTVTGLAFG